MTYNATGNVATLCVGTSSSPTCASTALPAAYLASGKPLVFGGGSLYNTHPANAGFDEAAYWQGTVLTATQIATFAGFAGNGTPPPPTPTPGPTGSFADWPMYQNDAQHDGYVNDAAITPQTVGSLHLAWEHVGLESITSHEQPVVATNIAGHSAVLYWGGGSTGTVYAFDGISGAQVWTASLGASKDGANGKSLGIRGTGAIGRTHSVVYMPDGQHRVHALMLDGLADTWTPIDIAPTSPPDTNAMHNPIDAGLTLSANGTLYAATSSQSDESPWEGRLVAIDTSTAAQTATFFTVFDPNAAHPYSGAGIWSWGGAALDASENVYVDAGNAETHPSSPFTAAPSEQFGNAEHIVKLSSSLSVLDSVLPPVSNYSTPRDMDYAGTPVIFQPIGCADQLEAATGKSGVLTIYDTNGLANPPLTSITVAPESGDAQNITNPSYSPKTNLLYVSITDTGTVYAGGQPGMVAISFSGCTPSVAWSGTAFGVSSFSNGADRSAPTVTSGGVVLGWAPIDSSGTGGLFALDASSGALLNGGKPIFTANGPARMGAVVDGDWIWLSDSGGDIYGMTTDSSVPTLSSRSTVRRTVPFEGDRN
jgi:hypothetical protein